MLPLGLARPSILPFSGVPTPTTAALTSAPDWQSPVQVMAGLLRQSTTPGRDGGAACTIQVEGKTTGVPWRYASGPHRGRGEVAGAGLWLGLPPCLPQSLPA